MINFESNEREEAEEYSRISTANIKTKPVHVQEVPFNVSRISMTNCMLCRNQNMDSNRSQHLGDSSTI